MFFDKNELIFCQEGKRHTQYLGHTLFEHTIYIFEHTNFLLNLLQNKFAKDFVGPDSISTTRYRLQDRYTRKIYIRMRTSRKLALECIDSHLDLPNKQADGSIHAGLQAILLHIQTGHFIKIHMEQSRVQTVIATREAQNTTWIHYDRTAHSRTLKEYTDNSGIESVDLQRHKQVKTQGISMIIHQDIHYTQRYYTYTYISSDIMLIPYDFTEFKRIFTFEDKCYSLCFILQLVIGHQAQQDIQFCTKVGQYMQKSIFLVIFYQYKHTIQSFKELAPWKNQGYIIVFFGHISTVNYCMAKLQE